MSTEASLYIGLMSGTSMDGIDAAVVEIDHTGITLKKHIHQPYPNPLLEKLRLLCVPGANEIDSMGLADIEVAQTMAEAIGALLKLSGYNSAQITAIGSHGQTIRHRPTDTIGAPANAGFTLQIGDPNTLAALTGIPVVADFRRKDMALGGQGAPLAPGFHLAALNDPSLTQVVLNLGGIANITYLPKDAKQQNNKIIGFDTGPANTLIDAWFQQHHTGSFDKGGAWASSGVVSPRLLHHLLSDPYFALSPPKSTGREYFSLNWLDNSLRHFSNLSPEDIQATLAELTVTSVCDQISHLRDVDCVHVCGGGVFNDYLMRGLKRSLKGTLVDASSSRGIDPMHIEAMAFAWLAYRRWHNLSGNLPSVTGARATAVLGGVYLPG